MIEARTLGRLLFDQLVKPISRDGSELMILADLAYI